MTAVQSVLQGSPEAGEALMALMSECCDLREFGREVLRLAVNSLMSAEADSLCGAAWGQRSERRSNSRNGYRARSLKTPLGDVELDVPKLRRGTQPRVPRPRQSRKPHGPDPHAKRTDPVAHGPARPAIRAAVGQPASRAAPVSPVARSTAARATNPACPVPRTCPCISRGPLPACGTGCRWFARRRPAYIPGARGRQAGAPFFWLALGRQVRGISSTLENSIWVTGSSALAKAS